MYYQTIRKMDTKNKLAKRIIRALISEQKQKQLSVRLKNKSRTRLINEYCNRKEASFKALFQTCLKHVSPITTPQVWISQFAHSGGSLLNRLFDGHPAIFAFPDELLNGAPAEIPWAEIDPNDDPQRWIEIFIDFLNPRHIPPRFKPATNHKGALPFVFLPLLQKQIFLKYLNTIKPLKPRDVFDGYVTACFGAWLNYQNHSRLKNFVTVSAPGVATLKEKTAGFFSIYPDGRLICLIANPQTWYRSALQAQPEKYADVNWSVMRWQENLRSVLWIKDRFADRTCLISAEELVNKPEPVMRHLAGFLGLPYDSILLIPTFNGDPISIDTSFKMATVDSIKRQSKENPTLSMDQSKIIAAMTQDDYQKFLNETVRF
ncbi:hypothetical protein D1BOALGB6SA_986 [Olavius sp. associated proteobacterium Delta 1]|nr:hypothetical protein D1BOALGB6SA_986 [Olavius sp. associated proteobacterium Delta 1]